MHARLVLRVSVLALWPTLALAQSPKAATYLTDEQVKAINTLPGVDRQIVTTDIGKLNPVSYTHLTLPTILRV